jgi:hypothetical protein
MIYQTFSIQPLNYGINSHGVDRDEIWLITKDRAYDTENEAIEYVIAESRKLPYYINLIQSLNKDQEEKFIYEFCFGEKYYHHNRYFLGRPSIKKLEKGIKNDGIKIRY